jgi:hypothetical protein
MVCSTEQSFSVPFCFFCLLSDGQLVPLVEYECLLHGLTCSLPGTEFLPFFFQVHVPAHPNNARNDCPAGVFLFDSVPGIRLKKKKHLVDNQEKNVSLALNCLFHICNNVDPDEYGAQVSVQSSRSSRYRVLFTLQWVYFYFCFQQRIKKQVYFFAGLKGHI